MHNKDSKAKIDDLISNPLFMEWVKQPTPQTNQHWENWLKHNPERAKDVEIAKENLKSIRYQHQYHLTDSETEDMLGHIKAFQQTKEQVKASKNHIVGWAIGLAAMINIGILIGWGLYNNSYQIEIADNQKTIEVRAGKGERKTIKLPDNSIVILNNGSRLQYPQQFSKHDRTVELEGEGFFEVVKMPNQAFIVKTRRAEVSVLGTSFNLRDYPQAQRVEVAVATGKVKMQTQSKVQCFLNPQESGTFEAGMAQIRKDSVNIREITAWKDGILLFTKSNLETVFQKLELWYDVEIIIQNKESLKGRYTGEFQTETLEEVLTGIAYTSGFQYKIQGKKVSIF